MTPTQLIITALLTKLGSDTVTLAAASWLIWIKTAFTPGPNLTLVDADMATFATSTPLVITAATRPVLIKPDTGDLFLRIPPPAGGFVGTVTAGTNLPQTIYGAVLGSSSTTIIGGVVFGSALFDEPILLNTVGQSFELPEVEFTLVLPALV